jgi:hypothetical protein
VWSLERWLSRGRGEPLAPGPEGRLLFVGPYNGGIGGIERLTRAFADWVEGSPFSATMVFRHHDLPVGPYTVRDTERVRVLAESDWSRALESAEYRAAYVIAPGIRAKRWGPRLARVRAPRVFLDLPARRKLDDVCDLVHCEAPREVPPERPHVVALPDPRSTLPDVPAVPRGDHLLTVFTPYGDVKGARHVRAFCEASSRRLVWCWDPTTFRRDRRTMRKIHDRLEAARHPRLEVREAVPRDEIYRLLRAAAGYVCFSDEESLGYSMLDAVLLGTPLCARRIGVCRAIPGFRPTEDFARPVFGTYPPPPTEGFEAVFARAAAPRTP